MTKTESERLDRVEHYVHGSGWVMRLVAWGVVVVMASIGFALQAHTINDIENNRKASCRATITAMEGVQANAASGIRVVNPIPDNLSPELEAAFKVQRRATIAENARRRSTIDTVEAQEQKFLTSPYCNGVKHDESRDLDTEINEVP